MAQQWPPSLSSSLQKLEHFLLTTKIPKFYIILFLCLAVLVLQAFYLFFFAGSSLTHLQLYEHNIISSKHVRARSIVSVSQHYDDFGFYASMKEGERMEEIYEEVRDLQDYLMKKKQLHAEKIEDESNLHHNKTNSMKVVLLMFITEDTLDFSRNLLIQIDKYNIVDRDDIYLVLFSLDNYTTCGKVLQARKKFQAIEHCFFDKEVDFSKDENRVFFKINITGFLLHLGFNVFSVDSNVFFTENPLLYFDRAQDLNVMNEYPTSLELANKSTRACCDGYDRYYDSGFFFAKSSEFSHRIFEEFYHIYARKNIGVSEAFNLAIKKVPLAKVRVLESQLFSNGFTAFWMGLPQMNSLNPVAYHSTWSTGSSTDIYRAREILQWYLDEQERYSAPRKYVTYTTEDDFVTLQMEQDYLSLVYVVGKVLNRNLILPKFHCYVGQSPVCNLDAIFDVGLAQQRDVYEHSFLHHPGVPPAHLHRRKIMLPHIDQNLKITSMRDLLDEIHGHEDAALLEIQFPKMAGDGKHYSLGAITDRRNKWDHAMFTKEVESSVIFSSLTTGAWVRFLPEKLKGANGYVCAITVPEKMEFLLTNMKIFMVDQPLYIISNDPASENPTYMKAHDQSWPYGIYFGYDYLWNGHKLMKGHSINAHIQMEVCANASSIYVNTLGPDWLVSEICAPRRSLQKSACVRLLADPWAAKVEKKQGTPPPKVYTDPLEREEREKIARTGYGVTGLFPNTGTPKGSTKVTFLVAPQNISQSFTLKDVGGCSFGGVKGEVMNWVNKYLEAFYEVKCLTPRSPSGGEEWVDATVTIFGEERRAFPGNIKFHYVEENPNKLGPKLAVATVFKNSARYIREWMVFHTMLGVEKYYFFDQGSIEDWKEPISDFIEAGMVEWYEWDLWLNPSTREQTAAYYGFINNHKEIRWLLLIDIDEFVFPVQRENDPTLLHILQDFEDDKYGQLFVDRLNYGPSGHDERPSGLVIENYYYREPLTISPVKPFVKPKFVIDTRCGGVHAFKLAEGVLAVDFSGEPRAEECGRTSKPTIDRIRCNHYWSKSVEDFNEKLLWDGNPYQVTAAQLMERWQNVVEDRALESWVYDLKKKMKEKITGPPKP